MKTILSVFMFFAFAFMCTAVTPPSGLTTLNAFSFTCNSFYSGSDPFNCNGAFVSEMGMCWSHTNQNPTIADSKGGFIPQKDNRDCTHSWTYGTGARSDLLPSTLYYFRTYAKNSAGTGYGPVKTFTTMNPQQCQ